MSGMGSAVALVVARDLRIALRRRSDVMGAALFFVVVTSLFPLGVGPETRTLQIIGPGVLWVAALLASMLALSRMFEADYADGSLEQLLLAPQPLALLAAGKVIGHWLSTGLPLVVLAPLIALQFGLSTDAMPVLVASLALGTPVLSLIGAVGAALTLGLRAGNVLVALLVLPLYIPVLVFGAGAVEAANAGMSGQGHLYILAAMFVVATFFAPFAVAAALRIAME